MIEEFDISTLELQVRTVDHYLPFQRQTLQVPFSTSTFQTHALVDSGASGYFIDHDFVIAQGLTTTKLLLPLTVKNVDNSENLAGRIKEKVTLTFDILGRKMRATFMVTTLGKQAIILGLPWLEEENPDINWKKRILRWRTNQSNNDDSEIRTVNSESYHEPTYNLAISFIKGEATEETRNQWNESRMNKASLFSYKAHKEEWDRNEKRTLEEKVPIEFHEFLSVFSDEAASRMPKRTEYDHKIELKHGFIPK